MSEEKVFSTICSCDCGGSCILKAHVKDGKITQIETDDENEPQYRACMRGRAWRQRIYAPDRLKYPLKRVGERGSGKFERITWDEAIDTVAKELNRVREKYGPGNTILLNAIGDDNNIHHAPLFYRLFNLAGGFTGTWAFFSFEQAFFAELATFGIPMVRNSPAGLKDSKMIILWGCNPAVTRQETKATWYMKQAKEAGVKIVVIDPKYTRTATILADKWIPIKPTTDTAMLLAMAYVMINENLYDHEYVKKFTSGFDKFREYVMGEEDGLPKTPEWAENITSVKVSDIEELARDYATTKPTAFISGISPSRSAFGEQYTRATITLSAMTGNIGVKGGEVSSRTYPGGKYQNAPFLFGIGVPIPFRMGKNPVMDRDPYSSHLIPDSKLMKAGKVGINSHQVADAILKGKAGGYPTNYKSLFIFNGNYLNQDCNVNKTVKAFKSVDFIVDLEQFMTPSAQYSDIILPVATLFERNALNSTLNGGPYFGFAPKMIEPVGESKTHLEIAELLADKWGITDFNKQSEDQLNELSYNQMKNVLREFPEYVEFKKQGILKIEVLEPYVAFKDQIEGKAPFFTPSGKIEIYSSRIAELNNPNIPPIPKYIEAWESLTDPLSEKYPLQLLTTHFIRRTHSQFDNLPWLRELITQEVLISSKDAESRGIKSGDFVRVFNDRGQMIIPARVSERIMPGVVDIPQGAWYNPDKKGIDRGGCANVLTRDRTSPAGGLVTNCSLIQIEKAPQRGRIK
ncbi:MAG: molybdopterin-dependent oxidoreductase [Promethearchaeota archaeon]|jgi:anaerobic dimethyl sulfoxide reductase subunit A